ncbi:MAG: hypothetical protein ACYTG5_17895, partial [Planctomycetota bacterium]
MHHPRLPLATILVSLSLLTPSPAQGPSYTQIGDGCAGAAGVPVLTAEGASLPYLGSTFTAEV